MISDKISTNNIAEMSIPIQILFILSFNILSNSLAV